MYKQDDLAINTRREISKKLKNILYTANDFYGKNNDFQIPGKIIDSNIYITAVKTLLSPVSINYTSKTKDVIETLLYGMELQDFKQYDLQTRMKILESQDKSKFPGILGISRREISLPREMKKKGISKFEYETKLEKLEDKINVINEYKNEINNTKIGSNTFEYLNTFIDLYKKMKPNNGCPISSDDSKEILYSAKLLALIGNNNEVSPINVRNVMFHLYSNELKSDERLDLFEKVQKTYNNNNLIKNSAKRIWTTFKESENNYNPTSKQLEEPIEIESGFEGDITQHDINNLNYIERRLKETEKISDKIQEKFDTDIIKRKYHGTQAEKLEEVIEKEEENDFYKNNQFNGAIIMNIPEIKICSETGHYSIK